MLKIKNLSFKYKGSQNCIIKHFNLNVARGEIIGIRGDSGRGKTTLAKIIAGFLPQDEGEVLLDDKPLEKRYYCPVQLVFQHPELTVNPNWKVKKILSEVEGFFPDTSLLSDLSINEMWMERFPHELSGGELQRIATARILNPKTMFIIADEMTSMLDTVTQAQIWNALINFSMKNKTGIIVISHDSDLLNRITSRIIEI